MSRVAELIANDLDFCDVWLGAFGSNVCCFPGLWHRGLGFIVVILNARSLGGASTEGLFCHIMEPASATTDSTAVPIVQGWLNRGVEKWTEKKSRGIWGRRRLNFQGLRLIDKPLHTRTYISQVSTVTVNRRIRRMSYRKHDCFTKDPSIVFGALLLPLGWHGYEVHLLSL